ncbi:hypothetical protein DFP72DRAFT_850613 [Ephemerocybe angulata]|uniref:Uncharacterized protein n=1 Tax=Ephemerocybe angulata TaxID=980116 RepID=A0A8H6M0Z7_9AGAR|nr:hypothetical protein DFP72DRAFT_850613 [Tulosesus angulatus]
MWNDEIATEMFPASGAKAAKKRKGERVYHKKAKKAHLPIPSQYIQDDEVATEILPARIAPDKDTMEILPASKGGRAFRPLCMEAGLEVLRCTSQRMAPVNHTQEDKDTIQILPASEVAAGIIPDVVVEGLKYELRRKNVPVEAPKSQESEDATEMFPGSKVVAGWQANDYSRNDWSFQACYRRWGRLGRENNQKWRNHDRTRSGERGVEAKSRWSMAWGEVASRLRNGEHIHPASAEGVMDTTQGHASPRPRDVSPIRLSAKGIQNGECEAGLRAAETPKHERG